MPANADELVALLDLETLDENLFRGISPTTRMQRVFGGQVAGQAVVAAERTVDEEMAMHSLHSYFLRPGDPSVPIIYDVDRVRDGRSFATRRVLGRQHGRPIFALTASFQRFEEGFEHQDVMPEVPDPDDCPDAVAALGHDEEQAEEWEKEWAVLDLRFIGDSREGGRLHQHWRPARAQYWVKVKQKLPDSPLIHRAVLTYMSDLTLLGASLIPHRDEDGGKIEMQVASLDHAVWLHRPFRADEWLLYDQSSPSATGGRGFATARMFSRDGSLVATFTQEGLIRTLRPGKFWYTAAAD